MRRESLSIGLACALGSFIGALVALETSLFWGIGALIGGLVAYCAIDFRSLCAGVSRAYRNTLNWKPDRQYLEAWVCMCGSIIAISSSFLVFIAWPILLLWHTHSQNDAIILSLLLVAAAIGIHSKEIELLVFDYSFDQRESYWGILRSIVAESLMWVLYVNAISVAFFLLRGIVVFIVVVLPQLVWHFAPLAFKYVHSERRLICFLDATMGAIVGFFLGGAVYGAALGALLGVVHYEVVLIRWLKIVPVEVKS